MTEREWDRYNADDSDEVAAVCKANLDAILREYDARTVADLGRNIYRSTDCGAWLSVRRDDGVWFHTGHLHELDGHVWALLVGSIVEGSDADVTGEVLELAAFAEPQHAVDALAAQLTMIECEAEWLWEEAHSENDEEA